MPAIPSLSVNRRALFAVAIALVLPATLGAAPFDEETQWSFMRRQGADNARTVDQEFSGRFERPAGPQWLLNLLPSSISQLPRARTGAFLFDSAGDRIELDGGYAAPVRDVFDARVFFADVSVFGIHRDFSAPVPNTPSDIKQFDGNGTSSGSWALPGNWAADGVPTSSDDVIFDNVFRNPLQNVNLAGGSQVANSISLALTTDQSWALGAQNDGGSTDITATLTLTTGEIKRSNTANSSPNIIGATSGTGLAIGGVTTLATTAPGFTITNQDTDGFLVIDAIISGATKTVTKAGAGTVVFGGANTYTGTTTVTAGTLLIFGDQSAATGAVSVKNVGTVLGGGGTIGGAVTVDNGATITGGTVGGVGSLTLNSDLTFSATSGTTGTYRADLINGGLSDLLAIGGILDLSGSADQLTLFNSPDGTSTYTLATYNSVTGVFDLNNVPANYQLIYGDNALTLVPVPEPATWMGAALALGAIGWTRRRRGKKLKS